MKQEDWQEIIDNENYYYNFDYNKEVIKKQRDIERKIVEEYALKKGLEFRMAERELADSKTIFDIPFLSMLDIELNSILRLPRGLTAEQELKELMNFGEIAISEFEKTGARTIIFTYVHPSLSTFGGFTGAPWNEELHITRLIEKYEANQKMFTIGAGMGTVKPLYFQFRYKNKLGGNNEKF